MTTVGCIMKITDWAFVQVKESGHNNEEVVTGLIMKQESTYTVL